MYSRLDPLGLCMHHVHITDDHSNPSTSKNCSEVRNLKTDIGFGCDKGHYGKCNIMHSSESVFDSVMSTTRLLADGAFEAPDTNKTPYLPKRARSCHGRVEASVTDTSIHPPQNFLSRTRTLSFANSKDLCETDIIVHYCDFESDTISHIPYHGAADPKIKKENDHKDSEERRDLEAHMKKHSRPVGPGKDGAEPAPSFLRLAPTVQSTNELYVPTAHFGALPRKRKMEIEEAKNEEIVLALRFKKVKKGTKNVGPLLFAQSIVDTAGDSTRHVCSKALSSHFHASDWSTTDWNHGVIASQHHSYNKHNNFDITESVPKSNGNPKILVIANSSTASPWSGFSRSKVLSYPDTSTGHFVSALHKFNQLIPDRDPLGRFNSRPGWCLANINDGSRRCQGWMPSETQPRIRQLFASLAVMDFDHNPRMCVIQLAKMTNLAICYRHRINIRDKVRLLGPPEPLINSANSFADYTERNHVTTADMNEQSNTTSMIAGLMNKITFWLREIPKTALQYLPEYLPYHDPSSSHLNVSKWVMKQAEEPLSAKNPNELSSGYLYVYWNRASFGVWKIGYTSTDVTSRLKQWEIDCNHIAEERYRSPHRLLNAGRVERLVHAELKDYRVFEPACHGCLKSHIEWFKNVDFEVVLESIEFWTQWITNEPYEKRGGQTCLKRDGRTEILQRYTALNRASAGDTEERSLTSGPRRYDLRHRDSKLLAGSSPSREDSTPTRP